MIMNLDPRFGAFFMLTGVTFFAFASGFSVCLFDIDTVDQCAALSRHWMEKFQIFGDYLIQWFFALVRAVLKQY